MSATRVGEGKGREKKNINERKFSMKFIFSVAQTTREKGKAMMGQKSVFQSPVK